MTYRVRYNPFTKLYHVLNVLTGLAQSAWVKPHDAYATARDLNRRTV